MVREDMAEEMEDNDRDEGKMIYRKDQTISQGFKRQRCLRGMLEIFGELKH